MQSIVGSALGVSLMSRTGPTQYWSYTPYVFEQDPEVAEQLKRNAQSKRDRKDARRLLNYTGVRS